MSLVSLISVVSLVSLLFVVSLLSRTCKSGLSRFAIKLSIESGGFCSRIITLSLVVFRLNKFTKEEEEEFNKDESDKYLLECNNHINNLTKLYPFLEIVYDSKEDKFSYHVKIFKINYEKFDKLAK